MRLSFSRVAFLGVLALFVRGVAMAEVRMPHLIGDHAVLQRNAPLHIWGWATPHANLTVLLHDQKLKATADGVGRWGVWFSPETAGGPYTLVVDGDGGAKVHDLLIGDVWVASGQSNMQLAMKGRGAIPESSAKDIASAKNPKIRLMIVRHKAADYPLDDVADSWTECNPTTVLDFSQVAYLFGREIQQKEDVPIGVIDSSVGGTVIESWISQDALSTSPALGAITAYRAKMLEDDAERVLHWTLNEKDVAAAKAEKRPAPKTLAQRSAPLTPSELYNGMIAPVAPYTVKGWLWYQGESNAYRERAGYYASLLSTLVTDWRQQFGQGDLPFLIVQLPSWGTKDLWGVIRDAERRTLILRSTAMAVSIDVGVENNLHPPDKHAIATRLALAARGMVYGEPVEYISPEFRQVTHEDDSLRVWFDHAHGLKATGPINDFEVAGKDHQFVPADATIEKDTVVVSAKTVSAPVYVRYAWASADKGSIQGGTGLPAGTFTSEPTPSIP